MRACSPRVSCLDLSSTRRLPLSLAREGHKWEICVVRGFTVRTRSLPLSIDCARPTLLGARVGIFSKRRVSAREQLL